MRREVTFDRESDGRWIAEVRSLSGVVAYGRTRAAALSAVQALALHVIADRIEHGEAVVGPASVSFITAR